MTELQLSLDFDRVEPEKKVEPKIKARLKPQITIEKETLTKVDIEVMAQTVANHPDYRVLRRLVPSHHFSLKLEGSIVRVLVLDTETTGLDHRVDKIIELALLRVNVDTLTGLPVGDVVVYDGLEDPGKPISKEITAITGISDEMVKGQRLDMVRILAMLADTDLVIAHNAGFDRPFCEARVPAFAHLAWGCSFADLDWRKEGFSSSKLEHLALAKGLFYDAHRAEMDCHALLAVLMSPLPTSGKTGLAMIIAASASPVYKLMATGAPYEAKDLLKARAYRWDAEQKVWFTQLVDENQLRAEFEWLKTSVYGNRMARVQVEKLDADVKYSSRAGELLTHQIRDTGGVEF